MSRYARFFSDAFTQIIMRSALSATKWSTQMIALHGVSRGKSEISIRVCYSIGKQNIIDEIATQKLNVKFIKTKIDFTLVKILSMCDIHTITATVNTRKMDNDKMKSTKSFKCETILTDTVEIGNKTLTTKTTTMTTAPANVSRVSSVFRGFSHFSSATYN